MSASAAAPPEVAPSYAVCTHLTPTVKRRKLTGSSNSAFLTQRNCHVCRTRRTTMVCATSRECGEAEIFLYASREGRQCFLQQLRGTHDVEVC